MTSYQIKDNLNEIINHPLGNYVCQKLLEHCESPIISKFLHVVCFYLSNNRLNRI